MNGKPYTGSQPGHARCRKMYPAEECETCGSTEDLTRHHRDHDTRNNAPENVGIQCRSCHGRLHAEERWEGHVKTTECVMCGETFTYKRARERTCSRPCGNALSVAVRRGAAA